MCTKLSLVAAAMTTLSEAVSMDQDNKQILAELYTSQFDLNDPRLELATNFDLEGMRRDAPNRWTLDLANEESLQARRAIEGMNLNRKTFVWKRQDPEALVTGPIARSQTQLSRAAWVPVENPTTDISDVNFVWKGEASRLTNTDISDIKFVWKGDEPLVDGPTDISGVNFVWKGDEPLVSNSNPSASSPVEAEDPRNWRAIRDSNQPTEKSADSILD